MSEPAADVLIVGAGVAGLAAAVALSGTGMQVVLADRKPFVGGRAYSYPHPALEESIDSQHVLVGCCTNLLDLCVRSGADRHLRWYDRIPFLEPANGSCPTRRSELGTGRLPAPLHSLPSFLRASMLSLGDKVRVGHALLSFLRGYPASDAEAFSDWLRRARQSEAAVRHFWEPLIVSTLNDSFERCSTRYAGQVFYEIFLKSSRGGRQGIPTVPLSEFFLPVLELAERQGTNVQLRASIERIRPGNGVWLAEASDGRVLRAEKLLLALPFEQTARLMATLPEESALRQKVLAQTAHFSHAPFTTVHLWFDRVVTELDQAALLDTRIQWMFNKSRIRRDEPGQTLGGQYLELAIGGSFAELAMPREQVLQSALEELARFFPEAREATLVKSAVLKEARATFSVLPGLDKYRPLADAGDGLYLAGDWTHTGWPSTMEGAARSGRLAAEAIVTAGGNQARFLAPDLPAGGFMRFFS